MIAICRDGEIGKHSRLKICRSKDLAGSIPAPGTSHNKCGKMKAELIDEMTAETLLSIDGVVGFGAGEDSIHVYVNSQNVAIPTSINGVPVETIFVGEVSAY